MDSRQISDIITICRDLNSEKNRERKNAAVKLKSCLSQKSYSKALDKNYEYKLSKKCSGRIFTWDSVFRAACLYVSMETEDLQKANQDVSRTTLSNRESRKQEVSALVKCVVRQADTGSPKLKATLLFEHIRKVLMDSYTCDAYGQDYCSLFLKNVISMKKYVVELTSKEWHDFLFLFFHLFNDVDVKIDKLVLARIIHALIRSMNTQCDIRPKKIFSFFSNYFLKAKEHKSPLLIQHLLCAVNVFIQSVAASSRVQVCKFGEDIVPSILYLWTNVGSDELKEDLLVFLQTQMWCHHPGGVKRDCAGASAVDWDKWMSDLRKMYELLYSEIQQIQTRNRGKGCCLQEAFVDLSVDVCQQLFSESSHIIEVTQLSMTGTSSQSGPGAKKRRLESGWEEIRNFILSAGQSTKMLPWLQLVTGFIYKYPTSIPTDEIIPYLTSLSHTLLDCKRTDLMKYIMRCIYAFVKNWDQLLSIGGERLREQTTTLWTQVWMVTLRFVSLHNAEPDGYSLLSVMVKQKLESPKKDIWSLFIPSLTRPVTESVTFLLNLLTNCDIPEHYVPNLVISLPNPEADGKYPLRKQLIHWLLPPNEDDCDLTVKTSKLSPDWTAIVLVALTLRNIHEVRYESCLNDEEGNVLSRLEMQYLVLELQRPLLIEELRAASTGKVASSDTTHIPSLLLQVENNIQSQTQAYCRTTTDQMNEIKEVVEFSRLVSNILTLLLENHILTPQTVYQSNLYTSLVALLKKVSTSLQDTVKKEEYTNIVCVLSEVKLLLECNNGDRKQQKSDSVMEVINGMASVLRSATPSRLLDLLLDITNDKHSPIKQTSTTSVESDVNSRFSRGASRLLDDFDDDLDLEFDNTSNNNNVMEIDDLEFEEPTDSQETEDTNTTSEVCKSVLSSSILSENQAIRLDTLYILCQLSTDNNHVVQDNNQVDTKYIKSKIIKLLEDGQFDPTRNVDIQMMVTIVKMFTRKHQTLSEKHLTAMIGSIGKCVQCNIRDQEVSEICLELLVLLVPHVVGSGDNMVSSGLQECRESILRLVNGFWKLQEDILITGVRASLTSVLETLVQYDLDCSWSGFTETEDGSESSQDGTGTSAVTRWIDCLSDTSHLVRLQVASALYKLFINVKVAVQPPLSRCSQNKHLTLLVSILSDSLDIQARLSPERLEDEKQTRNCSMLVALATVICSSPVCEKEALFAMLKFIQDRNVPVESVEKILNKVSCHLGYKDCYNYLECHLPYLIDRWLDTADSSHLSEFPVKLLGYTDTSQFYMKFANIAIPILVAKQNLAGIETIATTLDISSKDLLKSSFPQAVTYILPVFAESKKRGDDSGMKKKVAKAKSCYDLLCKELSEETVDRYIVNNLDEIVANLLMCLYNVQTDDSVICNSNAEPNAPFYSSEVTTWTLDFITSSFSGTGKTLIEILSKTPDSIQKILLQLSSRLWSCHRLAEKRRILFMYRLFTKLLLKQFHTRLGDSWAFVLREVIHRLVYIVTEMTASSLNGETDSTDNHYRKNIAAISLELLQDVCHVGMASCPKELVKYLPFLVSNLMCVSELSGDVGMLSLKLLKYLVLEKASDFKVAIAALGNFPDRSAFKECRAVHHRLKYAACSFTLKQEVEHFLTSCRDHLISPDQRLESLKFLYQQLKLEHQHILSLATDETLCMLVCELIQLSKSGDNEVMQAAGRSLGVIGPVYLKEITLPSLPDSAGLQIALQCFEEFPDVHKYCRIFHQLNQYLTEKSIELVQCTSQVLKNLLANKKGIEFSSGYKAQLGDNEYLFHYLHPFRCSKKKPAQIAIPKVNWQTFASTIDQVVLWNAQHCNHREWVITLTTALINSGAVRDELLQLLGPVCCIKAEFCELVLPFLIHNILVSGNDDHREVISRHVLNFFSTHCSQSTSGRVSRCHSTINTYSETDQLISMNIDSVRTMLSIVQYLRQQPRPKAGRQEMTTWDNNFWLDIDYLQVAMAAKYCSAHFTALLYAEIWCDVQREKSGSRHGSQSQRSSQSLSQDTRIDTLSEASSIQSGVSVQDLLLDAYTWIGDPDGVYGCGAGRKADASSRICTYEQENKWDKAVVSCDILVSQSGEDNQYGLLHALQNFGASHVFNTYLKGSIGLEDSDVTSETRELQYEAAWKMGQWTLDTSNKLVTGSGFHECLYKAMKAVKEDHYTFAFTALDSARLSAMCKLKEGYLDSARRLYPVLADLRCVNIVCNMAHFLKKDPGYTELKVFNVDVDTDCNIEFILPTLHMKCSAVQLLWHKSKMKDVFNVYVDSLQQLATVARKAVRHQASERAIAQLKELDIPDLAQSIPTQIEEAKLYWARGEETIAKHLLKATIEKVRKMRSTDRAATKFYPQALSIYGNWLAETRSENPNIIMQNYMEKAIDMYEKLGEDESRSMDAYLSLGRYADTQYQNIVNYMNSSTFEAKQSLMNKAIQEAQRLREVTGTTPDRYLRILEKQTAIDKHELDCMEEDRNIFLLKAVENYIKCLRSGEAHNLRVFRLTSLWFNNVGNEEVNIMMKDAVSDIKTYKWLPLMYQLAARMDIKSTHHHFLDTLNKLIYDTAVSHPHHTMFCVLALANANRDTELLQQSKVSKRGSRLSKTQTESPSEEGRVLAAKNMIEKLKNDVSVGKIVKDMQTLCDAYIQLANWNVQEYKTQTKAIQLPAQLWLTKVKDLENVPVPTKDIKVKESCDYKDTVYIVKFEGTFKLAGGINLPKIISCVGSDGSKSRQLVKGKDDLRQDAVMQQVFEMVNNLLQKDSETRKRKLQIKKYKVIPLSQRSGLLEWCEGTLPIGEYLIGSKGAHARYRPKDLPSYDCRNRLAAATTTEQKYKTYADICDKFQPVFRHFCLEKFSSPPVWFVRRLAYTRSVATNSIVGYILGLGDRHPQNILIDCNTAELVHIDLGIAFEQGKILPTPETVPFRLTRDIEDAMGASGVEGVFRRCCEKTLEVMRNNEEAVLTILEVLLYDPLHVWTLSPAKAIALQQRHGRDDSTEAVDLSEKTPDLLDITESASMRQNETEENVNKVAERVLLRLRQKLQGIEDGAQLSLSGQVNYLIQEARNPKNLARIFPGWQPYI